MKKSFLLMLVCAVCANAWAVVELVDPNYVLELYAEYDTANVGDAFGIAVGPRRNIFITHQISTTGHNGSIVKVAPDGNPTVFAQGLTRPSGIIWAGGTDYGENLYVTEGYRNSHFDIGGVTQIGLDGTITRFTGYKVGLNQPVTLGIDRTGNYGGSIFVGNSTVDDIDRVSTTGQVTAFSPFPYELSGGPVDIAFDKAGNYGRAMFVCAWSGTPNQWTGVFEIDTDGNPYKFVPDLNYAYSVAIDHTKGSALGGLMYAVARKPGIKKVHLFAVKPDGSSSMIVKTDEHRNTEAPRVRVGADGALYLLYNNAAGNTVQIYRITAKPIAMAIMELKNAIAEKKAAIESINFAIAAELSAVRKLNTGRGPRGPKMKHGNDVQKGPQPAPRAEPQAKAKGKPNGGRGGNGNGKPNRAGDIHKARMQILQAIQRENNVKKELQKSIMTLRDAIKKLKHLSRPTRPE